MINFNNIILILLK